MRRWPLVGRQVELSYLQELISDPTRPGIVVAGAAGVGKTRLLQEVVAGGEGHHVERITATRSAQALPFGAMNHLLPESLPLDQADLLGAIGRHLRKRADGRPALLVVDDAQLLDPLSATFIHHAATTELATTLLGLRSGEPAPDAITALYRDEVLARLDLQPISRTEFDELIHAVLEGEVETATLDRLWGVAAGNVLYMHELILDAAEAGTLHQEHGLWLWSGRAGSAPRLREMVFSRIGNLSSGQRRMLEVLAIAGPVGLTLLETLAPDASPETAERDGLIAIERNGRRTEVHLAHPLFSEAILQSLSVLEHRRLHHALADALDRTGARRREDTLRLAVWRLEAGDEWDASLLTAAARLACNLDDFELAERLARAATGADGGFAAALQLGQALNALTRYEEAETVLRGLLGIEPEIERDHESLAYALVASVGYGQGRTEDALQILIAAEHRVTEPQLQALLQAHRAALLATEGRFAEALTIGEAALATIDDQATRVRCVTSVGASMVMAGQIDRALAFNEAALPVALRLQDEMPRAPIWILTNRVTALLLAGRFDDALAIISTLPPLPGVNAGSSSWLSTYRGRIELARGKPATARRHLAEAISANPHRTLDLPVSWYSSLHAEACALLGDTAAAASSMERALTEDRQTHLSFEADARRAQAWVSALDGQTSTAIEHLTETADLARSRGQRVLELLALSDLLRLGETAVARRTADLAEGIDGPWAHAIGLQAMATVDNDPNLFESAAAAFDAMGSHLIAAELLSAAATSYAGQGLRARSSAALRQSRAALEQCEGARSPHLERAADPVPLSRREREVASLAAKHQTNSEIAARLHLSVRTVESHLYSAYAKLGIADRSQLAEALG